MLRYVATKLSGCSFIVALRQAFGGQYQGVGGRRWVWHGIRLDLSRRKLSLGSLRPGPFRWQGRSFFSNGPWTHGLRWRNLGRLGRDKLTSSKDGEERSQEEQPRHAEAPRTSKGRRIGAWDKIELSGGSG
jgi:hypothetical protein